MLKVEYKIYHLQESKKGNKQLAPLLVIDQVIKDYDPAIGPFYTIGEAEMFLKWYLETLLAHRTDVKYMINMWGSRQAQPNEEFTILPSYKYDQP